VRASIFNNYVDYNLEVRDFKFACKEFSF